MKEVYSMKKGQYFLKDKKCMIYTIEEAYGVGEDPELEPVSETPLWCYTKQLTQGLTASSGVIYNNNETRLFVFNYNAGIVQDAYIHYASKWYKVTRVDTTDDYLGEMFVYVEDSNDPTRNSGGSGSGGYWGWGEVGS